MTEDPGAYWVSRSVPYRRRNGSWAAAVVWRDLETGHELRWESEATYLSNAAALEASETARHDAVLLDRLLEANPRDLAAYWRRRCPWLYEDPPAQRLRVVLPRRPFAEWEREVLERIRGDPPS